jgi:hypothetical protein
MTSRACAIARQHGSVGSFSFIALRQRNYKRNVALPQVRHEWLSINSALIIVVPFSDSLVALGINGHLHLRGIEEEVLGRALH